MEDPYPSSVLCAFRPPNGAALPEVQKRCSGAALQAVQKRCSTSSGAKTVQHFKRCKNGAALQAVQNARGAKRCRVQHFKRCKNGAAVQHFQRCKRCFDFFNTEGAGGVRWNFIFGDRQVLTCRKQRKKGV